MTVDADILVRRIRRLMDIEMRLGAARGTRLRPAWATGRVAVFTVTTTAARLRALARSGDADGERLIAEIGDPVVEKSLRATIAMQDAPMCEDALKAVLTGAPLEFDAPAGERIAQWITRTIFLVEHEGLGGNLRAALAATWPVLEIVKQHRPTPDAYLLYELPRRPAGPERDAIVYMLQCLTYRGADLSIDAAAIEAIATKKLESYLPFLSDLPIRVIDDLHARGLISDEVAAAARADAVDAPQAR